MRAAEAWLGTPFAHRQRSLGAGVDCVQLLIAVYEAVGLVRDVALPKYPPDWFLHQHDERYLEGIRRVAVSVDRPEPGDIALFRVGRSVAHAGIVTAWPEIIHAQHGGVVQRTPLTENGRLLRGFVGWWSIVEAARRRAAIGGMR